MEQPSVSMATSERFDSELVLDVVSSRGLLHKKTNTNNQDAGTTLSEKNIHVLAVADGHGGNRYVRSDVGSSYAVQIGSQSLLRWMKAHFRSETDEAGFELGPRNNHIMQYQLTELGNDIVAAWRRAMTEHLLDHPIELVSKKINNLNVENHLAYDQYCLRFSDTVVELGRSEYKQLMKEPLQLYGTTLLLIGIYQDHVIYLQIGDGNIVITLEHETIPIRHRGDVQVGNETYSLSGDNAHDFITSGYLDCGEQIQSIVLSTDGVYNSFDDETDHLQLGRQLWSDYRADKQGFPDRVQKLMNQMSHLGSGDDCTLAFYMKLCQENQTNNKEDQHGIE